MVGARPDVPSLSPEVAHTHTHAHAHAHAQAQTQAQARACLHAHVPARRGTRRRAHCARSVRSVMHALLRRPCSRTSAHTRAGKTWAPPKAVPPGAPAGHGVDLQPECRGRRGRAACQWARAHCAGRRALKPGQGPPLRVLVPPDARAASTRVLLALVLTTTAYSQGDVAGAIRAFAR